MKVSKIKVESFRIELTGNEAVALKKILGEHSHNSRKAVGLNDEQSVAMSELFDALPYKNECQ